MQLWIIFIIYVTMSATGLMLLKMGASDVGFTLSDGLISIRFSPKMLVGFIIYVCSFLLSIYLLSQMNMSIFQPVAASSLMVASCLLGYFVLKEQIGVPQLIGIALILAGVFSMNISK